MFDRAQTHVSTGTFSMDQVAASAGVATSTVSRALRADPRISETTRKRIFDIAERLGYRPNPLVAALMTQLRQAHPPAARCNLAWLDFFVGPDDWQQDPVHQAFYQGAARRAQELGYAISRVHVGRRSPAHLARTLRNRGIRGVLVPPFDESFGISAKIPLPLEEFTVIGVGTRFERPALHYSSDNQYEYGRLAVQKLWELGYRRIGYVGEPRIERIVTGRFLAGYYATLQSEFHKRPLTPLLTHDVREIVRWLRRVKPDAVITASRRLFTQLREAGVDVPGEVALAHLNLGDVEGALPGEVAGIRQDNIGVGKNAVELLVSLLYHNEVGVPRHPRGVEMHGIWENGSTAPLRAAVAAA